MLRRPESSKLLKLTKSFRIPLAGIFKNVPGGLDPRTPTANQSLNSDSIESGLMTVCDR